MRSERDIEELLMDQLMEGEATMTDLAQEMARNPGYLMRVAENLKSRGLIGSRKVLSIYGRPEVRYYMVRTRKAA